MAEEIKYNRVLVKLSGESMAGAAGGGVGPQAAGELADEVAAVVQQGVQVALVVGGGNIIRARQLHRDPHIERTTADYMGMLATVINALALGDTLTGRNVPVRVMSAVPMPSVCESYTQRGAMKHLDNNSVVIFAGGTGNPFFTTDTCASLRASEIKAEALIKATKVDGVFDSDPAENPKAKRYKKLTYQKVLADRLGVMDLSAVSMCMENDIPIVVLQISRSGNLRSAICGRDVGTLISH
jgi:uridylate kinase